MHEPDPDNPERILQKDDDWQLLIVGTAVLFIVILLTPFVLQFLT